uniref:ATPase AAA-type core domain-containing protein n=1 Tax=Plectus sambesii TaxID=2011161 RepID=A0A914XB27_9BILA
EEKAKEEGLSSQELSSSQPLFPLFQRGRRSQILPAPEPEPPKKRGARKNTAVLNSDKNNASATSSPQPSLSLRRTRSQSKELGADAPTKDSNGTTESAKKTQVRKKSSTTAKPQVIEEVDLTINSPPLSARSCVPTKPPPSPVVERVHSRWLGECDCAPFVELINLADSRDLRGAATIGGSGASLKMRPKMSEEIVIPAWSSMGLVKMTKTRVMNGCDESPLLSKSLVHKVVESSFTADQKAVFSRLRSVEGDPSALVWTEASRPRHASHMLGDAMAVARVENWLKTWKQRLSSGAKKTNGSATDRMKKRGRKRRKSSDDESDYDDEDVMANPFVLAGATGVGKTALVYALAEAMGMRVIEMSSNARRATAQLRQTLTGATHTHRVSCSSVSDSPLSAFLSPSAAKKPKLTEAPPKTIGQFSIILIDDADILLPDDDGFWTTLKLFAAESRVPIVLTCADELRCVTELRRDNPDAAFDSVCLSPPTVHQLSAYLQAVALSLSSVAVSMDSLDRLCREYNCDVRRCLLAVQALVAARGGVRNGDNDDDVDGEHLPKPIDVVPLRQSGGESSLTWLQRCRLNSDAAALESTERLGRFGVQLLDGLTDAGDSLPSPYDLPSHYAEFVLSEDVDGKSAVERISHSENAVLAVRESLHKSQLCSGLNCISVDYCSFLAQMAKTSEAQQRGSRRHQHYFDKTTTDGLIIDPHDRLKTAFARAFNSLL